MKTAIALGSNLGDRLANLRAGRRAVLAIPGVSGPAASSRLYETEPVGTGADCGPFLNAVIEVDCTASPHTLLAALQSIEQTLGRPSRHPPNAPRTLDLDILCIGSLVFSDAHLTIPHPRLHLRRFVLQPLADIRPALILPGHTRTVARYLDELPDRAAVRLLADDW